LEKLVRILAKNKIKLQIDLNELLIAFEADRSVSDYYLGLKTGKIYYDSAWDSEEFFEDQPEPESNEDEDRLFIPPLSSYESYQIMVDFIGTVQNTRLREKLLIAIDGRGAFSRFKNVLIDYPHERERWFLFEKNQLFQKMQDWLENEGIEPL